MTEARLYRKEEEKKVQCYLCSQHCLIKEGKRGICGVRENRDGTLYSLVYGKPIATHVDPIEKKPLFHFYPGSHSFSVATAGCNFRCRFCQNADISQAADMKTLPGAAMGPEEVVRAALQTGCQSISYTYTEPTIFFEYAQDMAVLAEDKGLKNIFVTNGFMTAEMLEAIYPHLHAANVDLKSFSDDFYRKQCGARLAPILENLVKMKKQDIWVEITTLIIPTLNDSDEELRELAGFIVRELGPETPWHISRFHPTYKLLDLPVTPIKTLQKAWSTGKEAGLHYVYTGNVPGDSAEKTYCHHCGSLLLDRYGFSILKNNLQKGSCPQCHTVLSGRGL
jgi:pyruvate formate lyase activating enzyme